MKNIFVLILFMLVTFGASVYKAESSPLKDEAVVSRLNIEPADDFQTGIIYIVKH